MGQNGLSMPIKLHAMISYYKGTLFDGTPFDNDIGPVAGYPTSGHTTASDGSFHDVPFGLCQNLSINTPKTASQTISILMNSAL